jgi:hypothetical protein
VVDGVHVRTADDGSFADILRRTARTTTASSPWLRATATLQRPETGSMPAGSKAKTRKLSGRDALACTTWSDGENGGWFRQTAEEAGFFGHFFAPLMERVRSGQSPVRPDLISDYLREHAARTDVRVQTGAWNVAQTSAYFWWAGSTPRGRHREVFG